MRFLLSLLLGALTLEAQILPGPRWYRASSGLLGVPAPAVSARELERLERYLVFGVPYCNGITAAAYAANREMSHRMNAYLTRVGRSATDLDARSVALRLASAYAVFPCAYPGKQLPVFTPPPPQPGDPPFALKAPDLGRVPDEQQEMVADLVIRYDTDAARSAGIWKNGETLRLTLESRGMSLNAQTGAAMTRLPALYDAAAAALKAHNWEEALSSLQAAEGTTQRIAVTAGR